MLPASLLSCPMSVLDDIKYEKSYTLVYDWLMSRPSQHILDTFGLNHKRLCTHGHELTKGLLTMFYAITIVNDFTILHNIQLRRKMIAEHIYAGTHMFEDELNQCDERHDSESYYDELTQHSTAHGLYEVEAILEDKVLCSYRKAWIGYAYKSLWPFLTVGAEVPPGVHAWKGGKRTVYIPLRIPLVSQPFVPDDLYL